MSALLKDCWHPDPDYRPAFSEVLRRIQRTIAEA